MDNITLEEKFNRLNYIKCNKVRWEAHWLKNKKILINYSIASCILIILALLTKSQEMPTNIYTILALITTIVSIFLINLRIISKRLFNKNLVSSANKFEAINLSYTYVINDESVKYWDNEKMIDFKWSVFTHYSIYKEYLLLFVNTTIIDGFIYAKEEHDLESYNRITEIVKSKLKFKKLK